MPACLFRCLFPCIFTRKAWNPAPPVVVERRRNPMNPRVADREMDTYLFEEDFQRRLSLSDILRKDSELLCELWYESIKRKYGDETEITLDHLQSLLDGFIRYIQDPYAPIIENALKDIKQQLGTYAITLTQVHYAIYLYQQSVNQIIRRHPIEPHFLFLLENLVRCGMQVAFLVLSPEYTEPIQPENRAPSALNPPPVEFKTRAEILNEMMEIKWSNRKVLLKLRIEANSDFGDQWLKDMYKFLNMEFEKMWHARFPPCEGINQDVRLMNWLFEREIYRDAKILLLRGFTFEQVLLQMTKYDLLRSGIDSRVQLRVWREITRYRSLQSQQYIMSKRLKMQSIHEAFEERDLYSFFESDFED